MPQCDILYKFQKVGFSFLFITLGYLFMRRKKVKKKFFVNKTKHTLVLKINMTTAKSNKIKSIV